MKYSYFILFVIMFFSACNMLEVEPYDAIPAEQVLTNKKGLDGSLNGAYDVLQSASLAADAIVFPDLAADNFIAIGSKIEYDEVSNNMILASNAYVESIWNNSYTGINLVNYIIEGIDGVSGISPEQKNSYLAQCYFLRAFHNFNLVRFFGDIPLRKIPVKSASSESLNIPLSSKSDVFAFIIDDLKLSEQLFGGTGKGNSAFANEGAAKALLSKVYLYTNNWALAAAKADEVLGLGYTLENNGYAKIFDETVSNNEIIFQIDFYNDQEASNLLSDWLSSQGRTMVAVWKDKNKTQSLINDFEVGDLRKDATVKYLNGLQGQHNYCMKYTQLLTGKDNVIILRLADIYLIKAEALNELGFVADGQAFDAINAIRARAGLSVLNQTTTPNQNAFRLAVEKERQLELAFEGNRLFDLRRTNRIDAVVPDIGTLKEAGWYFPIPQTEMDTNDAIK